MIPLKRFGLFKNLLKTVQTISNLNNSKTPKEQSKVEYNVPAITNHGTFRPIHLSHSFILSQVLLMAFQNVIFSLLINPSEVTQMTCIFLGTQYSFRILAAGFLIIYTLFII